MGKSTGTQGAHRKPKGFDSLPLWQVVTSRAAMKLAEPLSEFVREVIADAHELQLRAAERWPDFYKCAYRTDKVAEAAYGIFDEMVEAAPPAWVNVELDPELVAKGSWVLMTYTEQQARDAGFNVEAIVEFFGTFGIDWNRELSPTAADRPETAFFVMVWAPCMFFYGVHYAYLHEAARRGEHEALKKVLRLNKTANYDRLILRHYNRALLRRNKQDREVLTAAKQGLPYATPQQIKLRLHGLLHRVLNDSVEQYDSLRERFPQVGWPSGRVTVPQLQRFGNEYAKGRGIDRDRDLPEDPETMRKYIIDRWAGMFNN